MVSNTILKGLLAGALFCITYVFSVVPIGLRLASKRKLYTADGSGASNRRLLLSISLLSSYGGGIFLCTCFLDLFPDCQETLRRGAAQVGWSLDFPLAEFFVTFGFLVILFSEQIGFWWKETTPTSQPLTLVPSLKRDTSLSEVEEEDEEKELLTATVHRISRRDESKFPLVRGKRIKSNSKDISMYGSISITSERKLSLIEQPSEDVELGLGNGTKISENQKFRNGAWGGGTSIGVADKSNSSSARAVILVTALSLHACFEGMALGLQDSVEKIWTLFAALCIHKSLVGFSLGIGLVQSELKSWTVALCCAIFCGMVVVGTTVGIVVIQQVASAAGAVVSGILRSVACGTFIYITFFEILPHVFTPAEHRLAKLLTLTFGVATGCLILLVFPDS